MLELCPSFSSIFMVREKSFASYARQVSQKFGQESAFFNDCNSESVQGFDQKVGIE